MSAKTQPMHRMRRFHVDAAGQWVNFWCFNKLIFHFVLCACARQRVLICYLWHLGIMFRSGAITTAIYSRRRLVKNFPSFPLKSPPFTLLTHTHTHTHISHANKTRPDPNQNPNRVQHLPIRFPHARPQCARNGRHKSQIADRRRRIRDAFERLHRVQVAALQMHNHARQRAIFRMHYT